MKIWALKLRQKRILGMNEEIYKYEKAVTMKRIFTIILTTILTLSAETLFEVKDSSDNVVLDVSTDGLRVMNEGDTLMVISSSDIRANIGVNNKGLSRAFSVTTTQSKGDGSDLMRLTSDSTRFWISDVGSGFGVSSQTAFKEKSVATNFLKVSNVNTQMREGSSGERYTDFSPENMFLGLNAGEVTTGLSNVFIGNNAGLVNEGGGANVFIGLDAGMSTVGGSMNAYLGKSAGKYATGDYNSFYGYASGYASNGNYNSFYGNNSGSYNDGEYNVFIGYQAGYNSGIGSRNVFLGNKAGMNETGSDKLYIDNSDTTDALIYGEFDNNLVRVNGNFNVTGGSTLTGNVGIGNGASPSYMLSVLSDYVGIYSEAATTTGSATYGVYGMAGGASLANYGIYGTTLGTAGTNWAGYFAGNINVTGTVVKSMDEIKIDHPIDPENKFLSHSNITSNERMNVYNGNVILDKEGKAMVTMPNWFESINTDFRYQLTAIGAPGPNLYISKKVSGNTFEISGGKENMEVSWMITGIRNDVYAKENPIEVEKEKDSIEKGYYLHPETYGLPTERGIEFQHNKGIKGSNEK